MDGAVQSFEQRSTSDWDGNRGNRVIIVNRREPNLTWLTTNQARTRSSCFGCSRTCCLFFKCAWCKSSGDHGTIEKSLSRGRARRRASDAISAASTSLSVSQSMSTNTLDFGPFSSNKWKTSKYTLLNFLPKNLFEQFRRLANFYFLITAILQILMPLSPVGPATSLIPLIFVISTTAMKQAYEDYLRHKLDNQVNERTCYILREDNSLAKACAKDIRVGDIVYVKNNEEIPCDMILLSSSGTADRCYITTANLDGESSLKSRTCFQIRQQIGNIDQLNQSLLIVECERPSATLYEFNGFLRSPKDGKAYELLMREAKQASDIRQADGLPSAPSSSAQAVQSSSLTSARSIESGRWMASSAQMDRTRLSIISSIFRRIKQAQIQSRIARHLSSEKQRASGGNNNADSTAERMLDSMCDNIEIPLDISNLLLRASRLRNTDHIYGLAVYTGQDTRLAHNSQVKPNKFSSLESRVNMFLGMAFVILLLLSVISSFKDEYPGDKAPPPQSPPLPPPPETTASAGQTRTQSIVEIFTAHFMLYNYLVPISLYVTLEFVKFLGTISVLEDEKLQASVETNLASLENNSSQQLASSISVGAKSPAAASVGSTNSTLAQPGATKRHAKKKVGPQCNSSDLNEDLGQVEVLFSDKTGTLTENKMHFMACSIDGRLHRVVREQLYEQPDGLCQIPALNVARKLSRVRGNRYAAIASELSEHHGPRSAPRSLNASSRSSKSSLDRLAKLPPNQRPFDHRLVPAVSELKLIDDLGQNARVAEFFLYLCLCSTILINEQLPLEDCLKEQRLERTDYHTASPDEESLVTAAALFGVIICKSSERECFLAIKRVRPALAANAGPAGAPPAVPSAASPTKTGATGKRRRADKSRTSGSPSAGASEQAARFEPVCETKLSTDKYVVRHFERLMTFEFNSTRKRMSVLYRDCDQDRLLLITKGSESVLDCIGLSKRMSGATEKSFDSTMAHFEAFSKSGLRTMLVARRFVHKQELEQLTADLRELRLTTPDENRNERMENLYSQAEANMELVGATAVEDCLQNGVPETIAELREAGIKVWLLTGDKVETAISVAYLCKLLDRNMNVLQLIRQQDARACKELLRSFVARLKQAMMYGDEEDGEGVELAPIGTTSPTGADNQPRESVSKRPKSHLALQKQKQKSLTRSSKRGGPAPLHLQGASMISSEFDMPRFALVADGRSLHYAMKHAKQELEFISGHCACVLGCRLSPLQKAEIVDMIKNGESSPITAAIGDGANDVSMIQEAHVGIGISGKEGRQAVNSSDFAVNRFHMLNRLFLVHGHLFYHRTANTIHFFFYKSFLLIMPQFVFSFYNLNTAATSLYHPTMLISYNMVFTSIPILLYGLSEVSIPERLLETCPRLYKINRRNQRMRFTAFLAWLFMGSLQGIIAFYTIHFIFTTHTNLLEPTNASGHLSRSLSLFFSIVLLATMRLYFLSKKRSWLFDITSILSCIMLPICFYIFNFIDMSRLFKDVSLEGRVWPIYKMPVFWITTARPTLPIAFRPAPTKPHFCPSLTPVDCVRILAEAQLEGARPASGPVASLASRVVIIGDRNKPDSSQPRRSKRRQQKPGGQTRDRDRDESSNGSKQRPNYQDIIGQLVAGKFKLVKLLGSGSYGAVYLGKNVVTAELVAVKLEHKTTKAPQLPLEYRFIKMIGQVEGFPRIIRIDECGEVYHAMVMELLGPSLEEVFNVCERRMTLKSVLYLSLQLITRFQTLHSKNIIYRDVKPENFLLGRPGMEKENIVHIIDYGLAKEYINPETGTHIAFRGQRGAIGTARYMSVNTHQGKEQSRRDDLEALGYVIIYLMRGSLPWQGLPATDHRERMRKIGDMKRRMPVEEICERCPEEFASYLRYVKHLDFYEAPDYDYLKRLFFDLFMQSRFVDDGQYDWSGKFAP